MREVSKLKAVGESAAEALSSQGEWIHRRVESITFPFPNRPVYRRHVSIDFTIPPGLLPAVDEVEGPGATRPPRYYVPLSLVRRWPPLPRLDLRGADGLPDPFLTERQNAVLDSAALQGLALRLSPQIDRRLLVSIAETAAAKTETERKAALREILEQTPPEVLVDAESEAHRVLASHQGFCALTRALIGHSLLWLRVDGWAEDRAIVKFSYDVPTEPKTGEWGSSSFGLDPFVFEFEVPHLGDTSSYHCNVVAPAPLRVVRAELRLEEHHPENDGSNGDQVRHHVDSTLPRPHSDTIELFAGLAESQAKFYASGDRTGLKGKLWVAVLIESQGLLQGALGVGTASVLILLAFTLFLNDAVKIAEASVAVLLISPAVLGYLLVRPSEEALAGGFLTGLRRLIMLSAVPPVGAATAIALCNEKASTTIYLALWVMTVVQVALLGGLALAFYKGLHWRKKYRSHSDASLAPD